MNQCAGNAVLSQANYNWVDALLFGGGAILATVVFFLLVAQWMKMQKRAQIKEAI